MKKYFVVSFIVAIFLIGCSKKEEPKKKPGKTGDGTTTATSTEGQDSVCGMTGTFNFVSSYEGKNFGFCSQDCKNKFDKNPAQYKWGYCMCKEKMSGCKCKHCKEDSEACACGKKEQPHDHDHNDEHQH